MRRKMVADDVIEAVIGLGPNLFYNSPMEACIVVCRSRKPPDRAGKVLLVDAVKEVTRERAQSFLTEEHIDRIVSTYGAFAHDEGFAAVTTIEGILDRDANLSIPLYVKRSGDAGGHDLEEAVAVWRQSAADLRVAAADLFELIDGEGAA